jgi:hypothetical protein
VPAFKLRSSRRIRRLSLIPIRKGTILFRLVLFYLIRLTLVALTAPKRGAPLSIASSM